MVRHQVSSGRLFELLADDQSAHPRRDVLVLLPGGGGARIQALSLVEASHHANADHSVRVDADSLDQGAGRAQLLAAMAGHLRGCSRRTLLVHVHVVLRASVLPAKCSTAK